MSDKLILIVDDEPDVNLYLQTLLEQHGYAVLSAESVGQAEKLIATSIPDLVCLDIMMPKRSGIALYQHLKEKPLLRKIPVIIISGVVQSGEFDFRSFLPDTRIPPPDRFFEKPIMIDEFLAAVRKLLNNSESSKHRKAKSRG